ncbi:MAG: DUF432 domain-containing protein [Spirochaetales bacterium]|nr:DUF432 domain-containing protein [Spirochaetales bacterium]
MFWNTFHIDEDKLYHSRIGPLRIWIKRKLTDWYIAAGRNAEENGIEELKPIKTNSTEELSWSRWVLTSAVNTIRLKPVMPDKPVVIRPENPIKIPAGNSGKFFVNIPVWVRIETGGKNQTVLTELPINILSKSWFGDTFSGELCYTKRSLVRKELDELQDNPCCAVCTVKIKNNSKLELDFTRFCLNVENLSIFSRGERLRTNHVDAVFRGEEQESQITISGIHSGLMENYSLISEPRKKIDRNIIKSSYQFLKSFTGI